MKDEQKKFEVYVEIQDSGATNMVDTITVCSLSADVLDRADCHYIMANYDELKSKYA